MIRGETLSNRRLGGRLLFRINGVRNSGGEWWEGLWDFQKLTTATAMMRDIRAWCLKATDRCLGAAAAGGGIRVSPVWAAEDNQIDLGMGVACASLIELLFMIGKFWVEEFFTGVLGYVL